MAIVTLIIFIFLSLLSISHSTLNPIFTSTNPAATFTLPPTQPPPPPPTHFSAISPPPPKQPHVTIFSPTQQSEFTISPTQQQPQDFSPRDNAVFSRASLLAPLLSYLGFNELATVAPSLSSDSATVAAAADWSGPYTIFAPSDASVRTCISCSTLSILREHIVPGLLTTSYLRKLTFGTKIETISPGRCITVTSTVSNNDAKNFTVHKIFIGGVEITRPDLFNNGLIIVHGLQGYISPLSPFSCDVERMTSLSFPFHDHSQTNYQLPQPQNVSLMRFMLRDAILQLKNNGFVVLSIALRIKYPELVPLNNVTIFALDDISIFSGSYDYVNNVRFHIVPDQYLTVVDLERLPVGTTLTTLDRGQSLVVTTAGAGILKNQMRINYVRIKVNDVVKNLNVIVHSIYFPFPRLNPSAAVSDAILGGGVHQTSTFAGTDHLAFDSIDPDQGGCKLNPVMNHVETAPVKSPIPEIEDHHGL